jgi:hypothetical protein
LTKLDNILNNTPEPDLIPELQAIPTEPRRVTLDETTKPPQNEEPTTEPRPRVMEPMEQTQPESRHKVMIDKVIPNTQTPRVEKPKTNPKSNNNREQIRRYIATKPMANIPQRNSHLRQTTQTSKRTQLIYDEEMNTYLNY